ncbi:hypothetical protein C2I36_15230, partial [Rhodobacteraceae bacterium WD3A24]
MRAKDLRQPNLGHLIFNKYFRLWMIFIIHFSHCELWAYAVNDPLLLAFLKNVYSSLQWKLFKYVVGLEQRLHATGRGVCGPSRGADAARAARMAAQILRMSAL